MQKAYKLNKILFLPMGFEFNSDGSLKVPEKNKKRPEKPVISSEPHVTVLRLIDRLDFSVGRKLLAEILHGDSTARVKRLNLDKALEFGLLDLYTHGDIQDLFDKMIFQGFLEVTKCKGSKFLPVLQITEKGRKELNSPSQKNLEEEEHQETEITNQDEQIFEAFSGFLQGFDNYQKKAIICPDSRILCVAGAGSGKTTVLTKRIEYLVKLKGVPPDKVLAITFTRKARQEMIQRMKKLLPHTNLQIHTFNSFCEKMLQQNSAKFYTQNYSVMDTQTKFRLLSQALAMTGYKMDEALKEYHGRAKFFREDKKSLYLSFVQDIFNLIDNYQNLGEHPLKVRDVTLKQPHNKSRNTSMLVCKIIENLLELKQKHKVRDYTDQIIHAIQMLRQNPSITPQYEHILVDEYQDVNKIQVELIDLLNPDCLFAVGDPRQSIFGWRGSRIHYITNFQKHYPGSEIVYLSNNYRSSKNIVEIGNKVIKSMNLPPIKSTVQTQEQISLISHPDDTTEALFIAQSILSQNTPRKEIFVLSRTNKQLDLIERVLSNFGINYLKRTVEEKKDNVDPREDQVTLSTVHAIKGLEAEVVFMTGVTKKMFPCLNSDHSVIASLKFDHDYDKYNEELRLLYVGLTRAKSKLIISYYNNISNFLNQDALKLTRKVQNKSI